MEHARTWVKGQVGGKKTNLVTCDISVVKSELLIFSQLTWFSSTTAGV